MVESNSADGVGRVNVAEESLPGIGLRHRFQTVRGQWLGLVTHRTGRRDLLLYAPSDPDAVESQVSLTDEEADTLGGLLGGARFARSLDQALADVAGVVVERLSLAGNSPYAGRPLGDTRARTRTGVSIVAILRAGHVVPAPGPADLLARGDVLVVVGTSEGVDKLLELLSP